MHTCTQTGRLRTTHGNAHSPTHSQVCRVPTHCPHASRVSHRREGVNRLPGHGCIHTTRCKQRPPGAMICLLSSPEWLASTHSTSMRMAPLVNCLDASHPHCTLPMRICPPKTTTPMETHTRRTASAMCCRGRTGSCTHERTCHQVEYTHIHAQCMQCKVHDEADLQGPSLHIFVHNRSHAYVCPWLPRPSPHELV